MPVCRGTGLVASVGDAGPYRIVRLDAPLLAPQAEPGQLFLADLGGPIREPLFPAALCGDALELLLPAGHRCASLEVGRQVDLLGPVGCPLPLPEAPARVLLVADGAGLPVLLPVARAGLAAGCAVAALLVGGVGDDVDSWLALLPAAVEVHSVGSNAQADAGRLREAFDPLVRWADAVLAALDPSLYPALKGSVQDVRLEPAAFFAKALVVPPLPCGVGACRGCAVSAKRGYRLACTDGPFFDLLELEVP